MKWGQREYLTTLGVAVKIKSDNIHKVLRADAETMETIENLLAIITTIVVWGGYESQHGKIKCVPGKALT